MTNIYLVKRKNMNSAIRYLLMTRERALNMVKMDRHLAGANWTIIQEATEIKHPYKPNAEKGEERLNDFLWYRIALCPECQKEVITEPSQAEYVEMQKEALLRILKAKKVSYLNQYEHGMLTKEAIHILVTAVEIASDRENPIMEIEDLKGSWTGKKISQYIRKHLVAVMIQRNTYFQPPRQRVALNCYKIVTSRWFNYFMYSVIIVNIVAIIMEFIYNPGPHSDVYMVIMILNHTFCVLFIAELILKLSGLGIINYFKNYTNILDLSIVTVSLIHIVLHYHEIYDIFIRTSTLATIWEVFARLFPVLRLIRFIKLFRSCVPSLIVLLDTYLNAQIKQTYDVGKGFVEGEEEILKSLEHIIDDRKIFIKMKEKIEDDRLAVSKKLAIIEKDYPEIAVNVKTQQAIRTILNKLEDAIKDLKDEGLLDDFEYSKCMEIIENDLNYFRTHSQKIQSCPPHVLLQEISWVAGDTVLENFLFDKTIPMCFNQGEVIIAHSGIPESLYVILYGVVKLAYLPSDETLSNLKIFGALPNVDYFTTLNFEERQEEFVLPGNVLGELGILTGRTYDTTAFCETSVQAYEISLSAMLEAMYDSPNPSTGLKARIWKVVALRIANVILKNTPHYHSWSQGDIKYQLERSYVPTLNQTSVFRVTEFIEDVLLIEGQVMDANSKNIYYAPCYIPRTIQKLIFPKNSQMNVETIIETKLLIIPVKYCDEISVTKDGQDLHITSSFSTPCLHHAVKGATSKRQRRQWGSLERSKQNLQSPESNIKSTDKTKEYRLHGSNTNLSEDSEKLQKVIEATSLKTSLENKDSSNFTSDQTEEPNIKPFIVSFEDEIERSSYSSKTQTSRNHSKHDIGSNGFPPSTNKESTTLHSRRPNRKY